MGIHHDYKSKRGERAMAKQEKRESKHADNADKKEKLSIALRANLQKRKLFQKKINNKGKNI